MSSTAARSPDSRFPPYLALGVGVLGLGVSPILVRSADAPGPVTSFYRMIVTVVLLAGPFYRRVRARGRLPSHGLCAAMLGGLFLAADLAFWTTGVGVSGATNPTLLANTAPLWVGLGTWAFFRERLNGMFWTGLLLATIGSSVILRLDSMSLTSLDVGSLFGLLSGLCYGVYFLITQRGRETMDSITYHWLSAISSALTLFVVSQVLRQALIGYAAFTYFNFFVQGLFVQVLGYLAINYALGYLPASIVSPTMLGQPVLASILAWVLLGEALSLRQVLGGIMVLTGVYAVHLSRQQRQA